MSGTRLIRFAPSLRKPCSFSTLRGAGLLLLLASLLLPPAWGDATQRDDDRQAGRRRFFELTRRFEEERDKIPLERADTIRELGSLKMSAAVQFLAGVLEKPKENGIVKEAVLRALGTDGSEEAVEAILTLGFSELPKRSWRVAGEALKTFHDPSGIEWVVERGWKQIPGLEPEAQQIFVGVLRRTQDERSAAASYKLLGNPKCPPETQLGLVKIVRDFRHMRSKKKLARLFKINDAPLKVEVLLALQELQATEHSKLFRTALRSRHWQVRAVGADIYGHTHDPELIPEITPLLLDDSQPVQVAAVQALRRIGGEGVMDALVEALASVGGRVKDDIGDALLHLTGEDLGPGPIAWKIWWKENRGTAKIAGISREEFDRIRKESEGGKTGVYYGLRVISDYVTFVVDVSGSMEEPYMVPIEDESEKEESEGRTGVSKKKGKKKKRKWEKKTKIQVAKDELARVLDGLRRGTDFNLITFSGAFTLWKPHLVEMTEGIREEAVAFTRSLSPGGMTNVYDTLKAALKDPQVNTIYFLSDGSPTMGTFTDTETILEKVAEANQLRKVKIHTIGFHLDPQAEELMRRLAEENFGSFVKK
ncbi:MAG: HEAT repeat domain-containing protein [Planctomycetota bacterium]